MPALDSACLRSAHLPLVASVRRSCLLLRTSPPAPCCRLSCGWAQPCLTRLSLSGICTRLAFCVDLLATTHSPGPPYAAVAGRCLRPAMRACPASCPSSLRRPEQSARTRSTTASKPSMPRRRWVLATLLPLCHTLLAALLAATVQHRARMCHRWCTTASRPSIDASCLHAAGVVC